MTEQHQYTLGEYEMFKWVVGLCAAMYLALVTVGAPTEEELAAREARNELQVTRTATTSVSAPVIQTSASIEPPTVTPVQAVASVTDEIAAPILVSATTDTTTPAVTEPIATEEIGAIAPTTNPIRRVTGKRVNLRAGPTTTSEIVGRAVRDDSAEIVELLPSGWAKVYILETGIEAYISAQFLSDAG